MDNKPKINVEREIARHIVLAQIASDAGKGIKEISCQGKAGKQAQYWGYACKDEHIASAIRLINHNKPTNCKFAYRCIKAIDKNSKICKLIYFNFKVEGKRYQISFHSFGGWNIKQHIGKGMETHWDHHNSRNAAQKLIEAYHL